MAIDYLQMPLPQQFQLATQTEPLAPSVVTASATWHTAANELFAAAASLRGEAQDVHAYWQDSAGDTFADRADRSAGELGQWYFNVVQADLRVLLRDLGALIPQTVRTVREKYALYLQLMEIATNGIDVAGRILALQQESGAVMNQLAEKFETAGRALAQVADGSPQWTGPRSAAGGGPAGGGAAAGQTASASTGGDNGSSASASTAGEQASASVGGAGGAGATQPGNPTLQGLSSATLSPPAGPPQPPQPPASTPAGQSGLPFTPPMGLPRAGVGGDAGAGRAGGGVRRGGVGLSGVRLSGGFTSIPQAAAPIPPDATIVPSGREPADPTAPSTPARGGTPPTSGVVPMSPLMGGVGPGSPGGAVNPGTPQRTPAGRGAKPTPTPGLPPALRGKAGRVDRSAFSPLSRPSRRAPVADAATAQSLDDELWQVDQASAEILGERSTSPRTRRRAN